MVRTLFAIVFALLAKFAAADAILWMVDDDFFSGDYNAARVMVSPSGSGDDAQVLSVAYFNEETWGYTDIYPDGIGIVSEGGGWDKASTGAMWSLVPTGLDLTSATFFIELGHYRDIGGDELEWLGTVATGDAVTVSDLKANYSYGTGSDFDNVFRPWDGKTYVQIPEPTSGILVAVGAALLALRRRRREVDA